VNQDEEQIKNPYIEEDREGELGDYDKFVFSTPNTLSDTAREMIREKADYKKGSKVQVENDNKRKTMQGKRRRNKKKGDCVRVPGDESRQGKVRF